MLLFPVSSVVCAAPGTSVELDAEVVVVLCVTVFSRVLDVPGVVIFGVPVVGVVSDTVLLDTPVVVKLDVATSRVVGVLSGIFWGQFLKDTQQLLELR